MRRGPNAERDEATRATRSRRARSPRWLTWSNLLTTARLLLAPVFVFAPGDAARLALLVLATATEWLDGFLARRTGRTSRVGEILDPIADRAFVLTALLTLLALHRLTAVQLLLLLLRDLFTAAGGAVVLLARLPVRLRSRWPGKIVTTLQLVALFVLVLAPAWFPPILYLVVPLGVLAVADYLRAAARAREAARALPP